MQLQVAETLFPVVCRPRRPIPRSELIPTVARHRRLTQVPSNNEFEAYGCAER